MTDTPASPTPLRVAIVGAGFAGLNAALQLAGKPGIELTVIDRRNHHLFQPLLYQVAASTLAAPDIARSIRGLFEKADNTRILWDEVTGVDFAARELRLGPEKLLGYDLLLLAPGARTSYFGNDHWARHCHELKTLEDAHGIRRSVLRNLELAEGLEDAEARRRLTTIVIVGGGPTGVELAGAFSELIRRSMRRSFRHFDTRQQRIVLVEAAPRLLTPYTEEQSAYTAAHLRKLGVEVRLGDTVTDIGDGRVQLAGGEKIEAGTLIWAAGVRSAELMTRLGVETDRAGRVAVEPDLSLPGHPEVFVAGDCALVKDEQDRPVPGIATAAIQEGKHFAKLALAAVNNRQPAHPRPAFHYFDKGSMAIIGRNHAVASSAGIHMTGLIAWMAWLFVHLLYLVGFRNKLSVLVQWASAYLRDRPGARVFPDAARSNERM